MKTNANEVAVFTAASEAFNMANIKCSIEDSINRFDPVFEAAKAAGIPVRGYVSCIAGCPYQGEFWKVLALFFMSFIRLCGSGQGSRSFGNLTRQGLL